MIQRAFGAAAAAFLLLLLVASPALGDVIILRDGQVLPKKVEADVDPAVGPDDPTLAKSGKNNAEIDYSDVKIAGQTVDSSLVVGIYLTAAYENEFFRNGENQARSGYWQEAADSFAEAAEALKGSSKQVAMYKRVLCLAETQNLDQTFDAAQQLLDAFPKAFYYAPVQILRARVLINRGNRKGAEAMLDTVVNASGMNARDYFEAKLGKVYFFEFKMAGTSAAKYAKARALYDGLAQEIQARTAGRKDAAIQKLKALVGIGKCYVYERDYAKARPYFDQVIRDEDSLQDKQLLAQAYSGLGDVIYAEVKKELSAGNVDPAKLPEIQDRLTEASLHYLRVSKFYVESAGDELYPATVGAARVWATQFTLGGEKDCDLAQRAAQFFFAAHKLLPRGEVKRLLTTEVKIFLARRDEACKVPEKTDIEEDDDDEKPK